MGTSAAACWSSDTFRFVYTPEALRDLGEQLYATVWRRTLDRPGFALVEFADSPTSSELRQRMIQLVEAMNDAAVRRSDPRFAYERLGRFDQQVTTKFHRDGAPPASLLILGYEPSTVASRLFVADLPRAAHTRELGANAFIAAHNPMFPAGEALLRGTVTELDWPKERAAVVLLNNSLFPDDAAEGQPLGVLHKGEILSPDPTASRVINSMGLMWETGQGVQRKDRVVVNDYLYREGLD